MQGAAKYIRVKEGERERERERERKRVLKQQQVHVAADSWRTVYNFHLNILFYYGTELEVTNKKKRKTKKMENMMLYVTSMMHEPFNI